MRDIEFRNPRHDHNPERASVWRSLWRHYFSRLISASDCVLDLGCGSGDFINNVQARRRVALDAWPCFPQSIAEGIETHVGNVTDLGFLEPASVDFAFASNLFEHISQAEFASVLAQLRVKLSRKGSLTIMQPNYYYAYREYFDDYSHVAIYTHKSLADFLNANGYEVIDVRPRFLPLTIRFGLPTWPILIWAYLRSPWHPMGKQMLLRARPSR